MKMRQNQVNYKCNVSDGREAGDGDMDQSCEIP